MSLSGWFWKFKFGELEVYEMEDVVLTNEIEDVTKNYKTCLSNY